jgi:hypothetical protein
LGRARQRPPHGKNRFFADEAAPMPALLCPHCGAKLFPHEVTNGECATCRRRLPARFTEAPSAPPPVPEPARPPRPVYDDDPPPLGRPEPDLFGRPDPSYGVVRQGVNLVRWGARFGLVFGPVSGLLLFATAVSSQAGDDGSALLRLAAFASYFCLFVLCLIIVVGMFFCCGVPRDSRGVGWARGLLVCLPTTLLCGLAALPLTVIVIYPRGWSRRLAEVVAITDQGCFLIALFAAFGSLVCFFLLLRGLARDFGDRRLGGGFVAYLTASVLGPFVGGLALVVLSFSLAGALGLSSNSASEFFAGGFAGAGSLYSVVMALWLLFLLGRLDRLLRGATRGPRSVVIGARWA